MTKQPVTHKCIIGRVIIYREGRWWWRTDEQMPIESEVNNCPDCGAPLLPNGSAGPSYAELLEAAEHLATKVPYKSNCALCDAAGETIARAGGMA